MPLLLLALILASAAPPARAQSATVWLDVQAAVAAAGSTLRLEGDGEPRRAALDAEGRARLGPLRPGSYRLALEPASEGCAGRALALQLRSGEARRLRLGGPCADLAESDTGRTPETGVLFDAGALERTPRPAHPWAVLRDVPGVVLDRVDVGGSDTARQSLVVSGGDGGAGAHFSLDGIDVTDPAALGSLALYPDMASLAAMEVRTSALDVRVRSAGAQAALFVAEPGRALTGAARLRVSDDALQSDNLPAALSDRPFFRDRTQSLVEAAGHAGGSVAGGRLGLLGAVAWSRLAEETFTEHDEVLATLGLTVKARLALGAGTLSLLALRAEKTHAERDPTLDASAASRWRQSGPTQLVALEDRRPLGGWWLTTRAAWLDSGFRLEPAGGPQANVSEDARGVWQGSYRRFETERPRLSFGGELLGRRQLLGRDHELVLGVDYARSEITTRQSWPGNQTLALERQGAFFRIFGITGFALPTRPQEARSTNDALALYVQDTLRLGRLDVTAGLRFDSQAGHNLASTVAANPVVPDELPAARYAGADGGIAWRDLLPRLGVAWDVRRDGRLTLRASYAAFVAPLGAGLVTFDHPFGAGPASLTYYWIDRNGDAVVQPDELDRSRGRLGASGVDPEAPGVAASPNRIDPGLRAPRTHEIRGGAEAVLGGGLSLSLDTAYRRTTDALWAPLRGLSLTDYEARGAVRGELFGEPYTVVYFAPASTSQIVPGNGRELANRPAYRQDHWSAELALRGSLGTAVRFEAWGAWHDWRERFLDFERTVQDPTPTDQQPLRDNGAVAVFPGGLGRDDLFVNARWSAGLLAFARLPWRLDASLRAHARQGFPIPYVEVASTGDPTAGDKSVLVAPRLDSYRLPTLALVDVSLARGFRVGPGTLTASLDVFNLLGTATALQVARDVELGIFNRPREIVRPRLARLGLAYRF